jgi:cytochrome c
MGELGLNKIMGALLATALFMMGLATLPSLVFGGSGGHYGDKEEPATLSEKMCSQFHYCIEIAEAASAGAAVEAVFDLGAALLTADLTRGERTFSGQCAACHTITPGGANGTGPNLHNTIGADKARIAGFNYSGALSNAEGAWSYENMDAWLKSPAGYVRGTSMSFAGIRKDADRVNVIAYLAANTEGAPPFPAPMAPAAPAEGEAVPADAASPPAEGEAAPAETPAEEVAPT